MPRTSQVACDCCGRDLTAVEGGGWRLRLRTEEISVPKRDLDDIRAWRDRPNPLPEDAYLCSSVCLAGWLARHPQREGDFEPNERPLGERGG